MHQSDLPEPDFVLRGSDGPVSCLFFFKSAQPSILLSGSQNGQVCTWNMKSRRIVNRLEAHTNSILAVSACNRDDEIITQGRDGYIHRWKVDAHQDWTKLDSIPQPSLGFCPFVCFTIGDETLIAAPSEKQSNIDIISLESRQHVKLLSPSIDNNCSQLGMVMDLKLCTSACGRGEHLIAAYESGAVCLWDLRSSTAPLSINKIHQETVMSFDYCTSSNRGLSSSADGKLAMWKISELGVLKEIKMEQLPDIGVGCVRCRPDEKLFAVGCWDARICLYGGQKMTPLVTVGVHSESVQALCFDNENTLAAGSKDKTISVWSVYKDIS